MTAAIPAGAGEVTTTAGQWGGGTVARMAEAVASRLGPAARLGAPLGALTTYRVGGPAAVTVEAASEEDLLSLQQVLGALGAADVLPVLVLGKGSNVLVADAGFPGLVVRLGAGLGTVTLPDPATAPGASTTVRAGGGTELPVLARRTVGAGLTGLEWAVGIPGTVGGAVKMNAGGHGSDTASCLRRVRTVDLAGDGVTEDGPGPLRLAYRSSALGSTDVVVWAELAVRPGDRDAGRATLSEIVRWRRAHQPGGSNAGSVFTNPPGDSAGRLVEASGLKGLRMGTARVSEKHANFIQADDGGSADDVRALMVHVQRVVADATGVVLHPEVKLVGFPGDPSGDPSSGRIGDGLGGQDAGARGPASSGGEGA